MKQVKTSFRIKLLFIGLVLIAGFLLYENREIANIAKQYTAISLAHAQYAADFSDNQVLMGASHNVFVGKVIEKTGTKERGIGPETQFRIEVIENIKGDLKGEVIVNQQGGIVDGILYVMGDDVYTKVNGKDYLLQAGETYLLATRYNEKENWYTLNFHPNASKLISKDKNKDKAELKELALKDEKVKKLREAYKDEILIEADVKSNNARNNFKSLKEKELKEKAAGSDSAEIQAPDNMSDNGGDSDVSQVAPATTSEPTAVETPTDENQPSESIETATTTETVE